MNSETFPCWYCKEPIPMNGPCGHDDAFSREWDSPVHKSCIKKALKKDPSDEEALLFAKELLSFQDGIDFVIPPKATVTDLKPMKNDIALADKYVFEDNGHLFSNNNDECANAVEAYLAGKLDERGKNLSRIEGLEDCNKNAVDCIFDLTCQRETLIKNLKEAVITINEVQSEISWLTKGDSTVSRSCLAAWNKNARFLSDNFSLQSEYLDSLKAKKETDELF